MDTYVILFCFSALILILVHLRIIITQASNIRISKANNKKLEALCKGLYNEYEKVKGPEWATKTIQSVIKDVVNRKETTYEECT